jgi:glycosyltransferase involved in cell wall biosynthesis
MKNRKPNLLFIAQTPPPHLGQSIMHQFLIDADWEKVNKKHIRVELSGKSDQFGVFSFHKLFNVLKVILEVWSFRINGEIDILYYPPSGPVNRKTFYKDLSLLLLTRFLAKKTVFHFHADKFNDLLIKLNKLELLFANVIYGKPDLCIVILPPQVEDVQWLRPKSIAVIPNGIENKFKSKKHKAQPAIFNILYIGLLIAYKGIEHAVYTAKLLKEKKCQFRWIFVGGWSSDDFKSEILKLVEDLDVLDCLEFVGEKVGDDRWSYFEEATLLCLPTYTDLMPLCILEGMMMGLPIVTTCLRTLPFLVEERVNGLLSQPKDPEGLATNIYDLYQDHDLVKSMGEQSLVKFKAYYLIEYHIENMQKAIYQLL